MKLFNYILAITILVFGVTSCSDDDADNPRPNNPKKDDTKDTTDDNRPTEITGKILGTWYLDELEETSGKNYINNDVISTFNTEMKDVFGEITFNSNGTYSSVTEYNFTRTTLESGMVNEEDGTVNDSEGNGQFTYTNGANTFKMKSSKSGSTWVVNNITTLTDNKFVFVAKLVEEFPPSGGFTSKKTSDMTFSYSK
jgi:hypothetical protein